MFLLAACSTADTTGDITKREYDITIRNNGSGNIVLYTPLSVDAQTDQKTNQTTDNDPANTISPKTEMSIPDSIALSGAKSLGGVVEALSGDTAAQKPTEILPGVTIPEGLIKPPAGSAKTETHSMSYQPAHNRVFTWLPKTGTAYGGPIKISFDGGCSGLNVPDAADDFGKGSQGAIYFCGTKNKPEEANGTRASVFGPVGCKATKVTIDYQ